MRVLESKKVRSCFLLLVLVCAREASAQTRVTPIRLVPPNAVAVAKINWTVVRQDDRFRAMLNADQLDKALAQLKISGDEISDIVMFSGINSSPTGVVGGIFWGTYSVAAVNAQLKSQGFIEDVYKGRTIYVDRRDQSCSSVLRSGMLAVGSRKGVEGIIDVEINPRLSLTSKPPFTTLLTRFARSRQPISFMMALPLEYQAVGDVATKVVSTVFSLSGLGPLGYIVDKIGFPKVLGFSIERRLNTFPTELVAEMKDSYSAALISGTLNVAQTIDLQMLSDRMSPSDREMLKNISVNRDGALLSIKMILREQDLPQPTRKMNK
jgi:hypothetical protein